MRTLMRTLMRRTRMTRTRTTRTTSHTSRRVLAKQNDNHGPKTFFARFLLKVVAALPDQAAFPTPWVPQLDPSYVCDTCWERVSMCPVLRLVQPAVLETPFSLYRRSVHFRCFWSCYSTAFFKPPPSCAVLSEVNKRATA